MTPSPQHLQRLADSPEFAQLPMQLAVNQEGDWKEQINAAIEYAVHVYVWEVLAYAEQAFVVYGDQLKSLNIFWLEEETGKCVDGELLRVEVSMLVNDCYFSNQNTYLFDQGDVKGFYEADQLKTLKELYFALSAGLTPHFNDKLDLFSEFDFNGLDSAQACRDAKEMVNPRVRSHLESMVLDMQSPAGVGIRVRPRV